MQRLVERMLERGLRPFEIARRLSVSYDLVHEIAHRSGIRYAGRHLTEDEKREVQRLREIQGLSVRQIASELGLSKTTVGRWSRVRFLQIEGQGGKEVQPEKLKKARRCPEHGLVLLWPCVACAAKRNQPI